MAIVDQRTDSRHRILYQLSQEYPGAIGALKHASVSDEDILPKTAYAFPQAELFPIHTPEQALLSKLYAVKQAHLVPSDVMSKINSALEIYGIAPVFGNEKVASDVDDSEHYLLPQYKALLVKSAEHIEPVTTALMEQRYQLTAQTMADACTRLIKKASLFGLKKSDLPIEVFKYAGLTSCDAGVLLDWVESRSCVAPTIEIRNAYTKIAQAIEKNFPANGMIQDRDSLVKIAGILEAIDKEAELFPRYGRTLLDPVETVFNMDKIAMSEIMLAGKPVNEEKLVQIAQSTSVLQDILGDEWMRHVSNAQGDIDQEMLATVLQTLPGDLQQVLYKQIEAYL